jgi:predicted nucleic acid-binding protein
MATLTVRGLPESVYQGIKDLAERNGRSMETEARSVLAEAARAATWLGGVGRRDPRGPRRRPPGATAHAAPRCRTVIILDTNVVSEPIKPMPDAGVLDWIATRRKTLAVTSITRGELLAGARLLPRGARRDAILRAIESVLMALPVRLPYDEDGARVHAELQEKSRRCGRPLSREDGMIADVCISRRATLATRNTGDFEHLPVEVVNPWNAD